ncbi:hypothetical protein CAEBREN_04970 [Caenorhabditis brenneri]|uniref:Uncharacterized protein n=1 Tax=Caenorhabditis brenneri TaxID=135651 RepID=G0P8M2_CAEBE|nr:hypothetical protein CAEBREN_04970 [Caenorhabditis brenneri]
MSGDANSDVCGMPILTEEEISMFFDWSDSKSKPADITSEAPEPSVSKYISSDMNLYYSDMPTLHAEKTNVPVDWSGKHRLDFERRSVDTEYSNDRRENRTSIKTLDEEFGQFVKHVIEESEVIEKDGEFYYDPEMERSYETQKQKNAIGSISEHADLNEHTGMAHGDDSFADGKLYHDTKMATVFEPFGVSEKTKQSQEQANAMEWTMEPANCNEGTGMTYEDNSFTPIIRSSVVKEQNGCSYCICQRCGFGNLLPAHENDNQQLNFEKNKSHLLLNPDSNQPVTLAQMVSYQHISADRINELLDQPVPREIDIVKLHGEIANYLNYNRIAHKIFAERILNLTYNGWTYYSNKSDEKPVSGRAVIARMYNFYILDPTMKRAALNAQLFKGKKTHLIRKKEKQKRLKRS